MKQITVIGSGGEVSEEVYRMAEELGRLIAKRGAAVICGGRGGVMEAVCRGAKLHGGLTIGILPYGKGEANPYVDIAIVTGMGEGRNVINVKSGDAVIAVAGGAGTLSEIGLALAAGKRVVALKNSGGAASMLAGKTLGGLKVLSADSVEEAVDLALRE